MAQTDVTQFVAKLIYERTYHRIWEDATQWARKDSVSCAETVIDALRHAALLPGEGGKAEQHHDHPNRL
ncbi:hypothetical protein V5F77_15900 [Xanthobacter sp. DSM 24535]|uniref:hypothetical protein n=1 Tax=Roseixanthobacter psychrophilus TaxID=3119917 RepID=UPI00372A103E